MSTIKDLIGRLKRGFWKSSPNCSDRLNPALTQQLIDHAFPAAEASPEDFMLKQTVLTLVVVLSSSFVALAGAEQLESQSKQKAMVVAMPTEGSPAPVPAKNKTQLRSYENRTQMQKEIDAHLDEARAEVKRLTEGATFLPFEARHELNRKVSEIKKQTWADLYLIQARWARSEGRLDDAAQMEAIAERTLNPVKAPRRSTDTPQRRSN